MYIVIDFIWRNTFLGGKKNGFFIECGAYTGEELSNSLFFELKRNFTGKCTVNMHLVLHKYYISVMFDTVICQTLPLFIYLVRTASRTEY